MKQKYLILQRVEGWEVDVEGVLEGRTLTVGTSDITLTAKWSVSDDAVAKIGYDYYTSVADAIMEAQEGDIVELIKDQEEDVTNDKNIEAKKSATMSIVLKKKCLNMSNSYSNKIKIKLN